MGKPRVLIVDDEPLITDGLREFLRQDYTIFTAANAQQALGILGAEPVDVLVSDYVMPVQDGLSLLIEVKRRHPEVIRALMTAYADMQLVIRAMNEGEIHRFIAKPYRPFEFRRILEDCVAMSRIVGGRASHPQGRTILLAHDSVISLAALRLLLTPAYQVLSTSSGIEALDFLSTRRIDAVVLGVGLEQLDGCSISSYLKQEKKSRLPLVFWASGVGGAYEDYLRECGADLVLDQNGLESPERLQQFLKERFA